MGCLTKIGAVVLIAVAGAGTCAYLGGVSPGALTAQLRDAARSAKSRVLAETQADSTSASYGFSNADPRERWVAIDDATTNDSVVVATRQQVIALSGKSGPAFATFTATDIASTLGAALQRVLPNSRHNAELALVDDQLLLRANIELRDFAGNGPVAALLGGSLNGVHQLRVGGTVDVAKPGVGTLNIRHIRIKNIDVPSMLIPTFVAELRKRQRNVNASDSLPSTAIAFPIPAAIGDIRIRGGRMTFYRAVP